jgi:flagellar hook-associated protein 1 FlgK
MSGLFTTLSMTARSLDAHRMGMDVAGQNVANVNTPGYARRTVDLASVAAATRFNAGGGVEVQGVRAIRDRFLERRVEQEVPAEAREAALAEILQVVEASLGSGGAAIDARLSQFFGAFSRLADAPTSAVARDDVLNQGQQLAQSFRDTAARLADGQRAADTRARESVAGINALAERIAAVNRAYGSVGPGQQSLHLKDELTALIHDLSQLVDVDVVEKANGGVDITIGQGRALVIGEFSYALDAVPGPPNGLSAIMAGTRNVTAEITGGRLGGAIAARDTAIPDYIARLDELAYAVVEEVNAAHHAGFDLLGAAGGDFFSFSVAPVGTVGAARAMRVDPAVAADSALIAAAGVALPGDNAAARAIADLRDAKVLDGNTATMTDAWSQLAYRVGRDVRTAQDARDSQHEIVRQVEALRDQISGVSLDEEAAQMVRFQRAYEANAKFFTVIDETLLTLLSLV